MKEYEYSFKVKSIKPYLDYCNANTYKLVNKTTQNRIVYENKHNNDIIARITKTTMQKKSTTIFDFKNVGKKHKDLKISNESLPLIMTNKNKKLVESIIETLDFMEAANNIRTRYVFEKNGIVFEIDDYKKPKMQVVAVEGEKELVDVVYKEICGRINNRLEE